ncbi:hypothetical protein JW777_02480, partial [bacterium]|nr:hypothetical protein [bacterium]
MRPCRFCGRPLHVFDRDALFNEIGEYSRIRTCSVWIPLVTAVFGSHTLLRSWISREFPDGRFLVDNDAADIEKLESLRLDPHEKHDIMVFAGEIGPRSPSVRIRSLIDRAARYGCTSIGLDTGTEFLRFSWAPSCPFCGEWYPPLEPNYFHSPCPECGGSGCGLCFGTGLHPEAARVYWRGRTLGETLRLTVDEFSVLVSGDFLPDFGRRLAGEILKRVSGLTGAGLGYIGLDRPVPTLSRGEAQRLRIAVLLTSTLEDIVHILDEPTIGLHQSDVEELVRSFGRLKGPVIFIEHDRRAALLAERIIDIGPGAGAAGGKVVFDGSPASLLNSETATGLYFSGRSRIDRLPDPSGPDCFFSIKGAFARNLRDIDVSFPAGRLTVISGVSGSGKSSLLEEVIAPSFIRRRPSGCRTISGPAVKVVSVDQSPIGRNPRSTPSTYTGLSDLIRAHFAAAGGKAASLFSFNTPEGGCPACGGMGSIEVKLRLLAPEWVPCDECSGMRFGPESCAVFIPLGGRRLSITDINRMDIASVAALFDEDLLFFSGSGRSGSDRAKAGAIIRALKTVGLGYLPLGQPSPSLSGGEAQRIKMSRFLGKRNLEGSLVLLDEPTTGLHPADLSGLISVIRSLTGKGATVIAVEHDPDFIAAADWNIDLGPGAGQEGGSVLYQGPASEFPTAAQSVTAAAITRPLHPGTARKRKRKSPGVISIRNAHANNLRKVDLDIPHGKLTAVTGRSGSGKSSLVHDVLEREARRRFLETLSMYERQGIHEGRETEVDSIEGLGVTYAIVSRKAPFSRRSDIARATGLSPLFCDLFALEGKPACSGSGGMPVRLAPGHFNPRTYTAACPACHGIGTLQVPAPHKLIVRPDLPLCAGAMYSPGFFPNGYLCKPFNHGYYMVRALAERYGFDPERTTWNSMSPAAREAFLHGDPVPLTVHYESRTGRSGSRNMLFGGFYKWVADWDQQGTYTTTEICPECGGSRLREPYRSVRTGGLSFGEVLGRPVSAIIDPLRHMQPASGRGGRIRELIVRRLTFLQETGLGYVSLSRVTATLSAGELQRVRLASLLGGELASLTVLLDEPSRGLHPREVGALCRVLERIRDSGNTVIVTEHDPGVIGRADHIVEFGPGAGKRGGTITLQGNPAMAAAADSPTGRLLSGRIVRPALVWKKPSSFIIIKNARGCNLKNIDCSIPLGLLTGVCGVSGSGKSSLIIDTLGRTAAPQKHTTSLSPEIVDPLPHDGITGLPPAAVIIDQSIEDNVTPLSYFNLKKTLHRIYAESGEALHSEISLSDIENGCSRCRGSGLLRIEMGFLPDEHAVCPVCGGRGYPADIAGLVVNGVSLGEIVRSSVDAALDFFRDEPSLRMSLEQLKSVGLGYISLRQPGISL